MVDPRGLVDRLFQSLLQSNYVPASTTSEVSDRFIFKSECANSVLRYNRNVVSVINPSSIRVEPGNKRIVEKKTRTGSDFFFFRNKDGRSNDLMRLTFTGSTGDIASRTNASLARMDTWLKLMELTNDPQFSDDGKPVSFSITVDSPSFPMPIKFIGHFPSPLAWEENAMKPKSRQYTFSFVVTDTKPNIVQLYSDLALVANQLPVEQLNDFIDNKSNIA